MLAISAYFNARRERRPIPSAVQRLATLHAELVRRGDTNRPNGGERVQAQVILTPAHGFVGDDCVLSVFNTGELDLFLAQMMDCHDGLIGVRSDRPHVSPLRLPMWLQAESELRALNAIVAYIYRVHDGSMMAPWHPPQVAAADWTAFVERVLANWDRLRMPAERPQLRIIRPSASVGSLVLWKGYHGNTPALSPHRPCVSVFVDYARRETFGDDLLAQSAAAIAEHPWEFGAGSVACRHAGYNDWANQQRGRAGGLARLGDRLTAQHRYLAGERGIPPADLPAFLSADQIATFERQSYLVVPPEQLEALIPQWRELCAQAVEDLGEYLNDVIFHAEKLEGEHAALDFAVPTDPRWEAVGGTRAAAKRHFDDEYAMYKRNKDGSRGHNAQCGGSLITAESGMGAATNLYDSPAAMLLQLELYPLFAQLYKTPALAWMPERFRVRTSGTAHLPIHTDTKVSYK